MRRFIIWLIALGGSGFVLLVLGGVFFLPPLAYPSLSVADLKGVQNADRRIELQHDRYELQGEFRGQLLQSLAGLFVIVGAAAGWQQLRVAREGQITDRFARAIDQLGSDSIDVRLGGIRALERIAKNSPVDRPTIQRILGAFVRGHAAWPVGSPDGPEHPTAVLDEHLPWLIHRAPDVQEAMWVLGNRPVSKEAPRLILSRVDLRSADLTRAQLSEALLRHSNLARAWLPHSSLDRCQLIDADLRRANLQGARLTDAELRGAHLQEADLRRATLQGADLTGADLTGARLEEADLTDINADDTTIWPKDLRPGVTAIPAEPPAADT
jgi:hypothetical protein